MNRTPVLIVIAIALTGVTFWLYKEASDNHAAEQAMCNLRPLATCDASMVWGPTLVAGVTAAIFVVAAIAAVRQS